MWNLNKVVRASLLAAIMACSSAYGQQADVLDVFNQQVDAFNQKDIDKLISNVSDDFKFFYVAPDSLILEVEGREKFAEAMAGYFEAIPSVKSKIEEYAIVGNKISFREVVSYTTAKGKKSSASSMGIYEVKDNKISRVWYFMD